MKMDCFLWIIIQNTGVFLLEVFALYWFRLIKKVYDLWSMIFQVFYKFFSPYQKVVLMSLGSSIITFTFHKLLFVWSTTSRPMCDDPFDLALGKSCPGLSHTVSLHWSVGEELTFSTNNISQAFASFFALWGVKTCLGRRYPTNQCDQRFSPNVERVCVHIESWVSTLKEAKGRLWEGGRGKPNRASTEEGRGAASCSTAPVASPSTTQIRDLSGK